MTEKPSLPDVPPSGIKHEGTTINGRLVGLCGLSLFATVALALLVGGQVRRWFSPTPSEPATARKSIGRSLDAATLNPQQQKTRSRYENEQRERLSTYGWVDRSKGTVHIPIDRAMEILVQKNRSDK